MTEQAVDDARAFEPLSPLVDRWEGVHVMRYPLSAAIIVLTACSPQMQPPDVRTAPAPPVLTIPQPWRTNPIQQSTADLVAVRMTSSEVTKLIGRARAAGSASLIPPSEFGAGRYHVHWDPFATPQRDNQTWIYLISTPGAPPEPERYLFVKMKDGVVVSVEQGFPALWSS